MNALESQNVDMDEMDSADEEFDDINSGEEAASSISEDRDSYTGIDDDENGGSDGEGSENKDVIYGNFGWADAMSKVLHSSKPKNKKSIILAKAKKDAEVLKKVAAKENPPEFEIAGEVKEEKVLTSEEAALQRKAAHAQKLLRRQRRLEWDLVGRVVPSIVEDRERERTLAKIGTRGVVQLFNSVKIQQKQIQDRLKEAGPLERKREKALKSLNKSDFLDLLQGNKSVKVKKESVKQEDEATWSVLRDDFMPQVTMRDWNKQDSSDSDNS